MYGLGNNPSLLSLVRKPNTGVPVYSGGLPSQRTITENIAREAVRQAMKPVPVLKQKPVAPKPPGTTPNPVAPAPVGTVPPTAPALTPDWWSAPSGPVQTPATGGGGGGGGSGGPGFWDADTGAPVAATTAGVFGSLGSSPLLMLGIAGVISYLVFAKKGR
jgi:hypothetical protein